MAIMSNAVQRGLPSNSSHSPVRFPRYRQTQTGLVGVLDLLLLQTDEPLQSQTPVLRHGGVQVLQEGQKDMRLAEVLIISWAITTLQVIRTSLAFSLSNLQQFSLSLTHTHRSTGPCSVFIPGRYHLACPPSDRPSPPRPGHAAAPPVPGTVWENPETCFLKHNIDNVLKNH